MEQEQRIALKFAYDGTRFYGFQRQPGRATVEGTMVEALRKVGAIKSPRVCGYRSSSRTDRGVSALGNVVSFLTSFDVDELCAAVNSEMEDVWVYSAVRVSEIFNPRAAKQRWYRYHLAKCDQNLPDMREIARRFVGVHDFSRYAKKDSRDPMRKIDSIDISDSGTFHIIDFRAESFLWNMVRRIVWMIDEGSRGRIPLDSIGPESKHRPARIGLARPEFLILMDIDCGVEFPIQSRAVRAIALAMKRRILAASMNLVLAQEIGKRIT